MTDRNMTRFTLRLAGLALCTLAAGSTVPLGAQPARPGTDPATAARLEQAITAAFPASRVPEALRQRLAQDDTMRICSTRRNEPTADEAKAIEARAREGLRFPADGVLMGDWKRGEASALSGYGQRMGDNAPNRPNGGNCYACHQMTPTEISYGTLGPSLLGYGRNRGNTPEVQREVYAKIYDPHAVLACSNMPRFGTNGFLTPEQIRDFVALLLDPASPVNR